MRVKQCCCGCSLRTGTLILLWIGVVGGALSIASDFSHLNGNSPVSKSRGALIFWHILSLAAAISGLVGVNKKRSSYLLPYIILSVLGLIFLVLMVLIIWIGSIAMRDFIVNEFAASTQFAMQQQQQQQSSSSYVGTTHGGKYFGGKSYYDDTYGADIYDSDIYGGKPNGGKKTINKNELQKVLDGLIGAILFGCVIGFALSMYFTIVVYSYYKQLQEEERGGVKCTGVGYVVPPEQPNTGMPPAYAPQSGPYAQQVPSNPMYPQPNPVYPQHASVYPEFPVHKQ